MEPKIKMKKTAILQDNNNIFKILGFGREITLSYFMVHQIYLMSI